MDQVIDTTWTEGKQTGWYAYLKIVDRYKTTTSQWITPIYATKEEAKASAIESMKRYAAIDLYNCDSNVYNEEKTKNGLFDTVVDLRDDYSFIPLISKTIVFDGVGRTTILGTYIDNNDPFECE